MHPAYDSIADIYDAFVQTDLDIPFFLEEAHRVNGDILELMAGTGRVSLPLAEALVETAARLTCIDQSAEMLGVLRRKLERQGRVAELRVMDVRALALGRQFPLVIIPFHAFPEITGRDDQLKALGRIRDHLTPDGRLIVTLHNPRTRRRGIDPAEPGTTGNRLNAISGPIDNQLHLVADRQQGQDGRLLVWAHQSGDDEGLVTVLEFFEEYDGHGTLVQKRMATLRFRLIERQAFEALFREVGLEQESLFGDYARAPFDDSTSPYMIWVLRRAEGGADS